MGIGELGRRLIVIFVSLVIATLVTDVLVASATVSGDIGELAQARESRVADVSALTAANAFRHGRWDPADLRLSLKTAALEGGAVLVTDSAGTVVAESASYRRLAGAPQVSRPVVAKGARAGQVRVRFGPAGLRAAVARLNAQRWHARLYAFVIAFILALAVSVLVARWITAPLHRLVAALRARGAGDRQVRITDLRAVGVLREILQEFNVATDALDRRDRAQRELIGNVAHELLTPVAILQAGTESMLDGLSEPDQETLASMHEEVLRLARRLGDLLALARASSATLHMTLTEHDLAALAGGAAGRLSEAFQAASVSLDLRLAPAVVLCDDQRMIEVITNLLTNALKYSPDGGTVTVATGPAGDGNTCLRVTDNGIGIPADELGRVTERFFRGAGAASVAPGSGIGLTVADELVRAQRGRLDVTSQPGSGTQVTISFPPATRYQPAR